MSNEYIKFENIEKILSDIGMKIISNKNILKLLYYNDTDVLFKSDLSQQNILEILGKGSDPKKQQRIFKTAFNEDIADIPHSELRFYIPSLNPENLYLSEVNVAFQLIIHNSIWELNDNKIRVFCLLNELLSTLNGQDIRSIGYLKLIQPIKYFNWNSNFSGYQLILETRSR